MAEVVYSATGRRKSSVARVRLVPGEGKVVINGREMNDYFGLETLKLIVNQPLELTETKDKYDILVNVIGGGFSGQAGAIRHGISRALCKVDEEYRPALKKSRSDDPRSPRKRTSQIRPEESPQGFPVQQALIFAHVALPYILPRSFWLRGFSVKKVQNFKISCIIGMRTYRADSSAG